MSKQDKNKQEETAVTEMAEEQNAKAKREGVHAGITQTSDGALPVPGLGEAHRTESHRRF